MTLLIFVGDMLVMAFMTALAVYLYVRRSNAELDSAARIPLDDELDDG